MNLHKHSLTRASVSTLASALMCLALAVSSHAAFTVEPATIVLRANMGETMTWIDVAHTHGGPRAVELMVFDRALDLNGDVITENLRRNADFTVFPSQIVLQPGERARVQVRYTGRGRITADRAFFLYSREISLPVEGGADEIRAGVGTLVSYYNVIAFETGRPGRLSFVSSRIVEPGKVELVVENRSSGRVGVNDLVITIGGRHKVRNFSNRKNSIMPGDRRRFVFEYGRAVTAREVSFGTN